MPLSLEMHAQALAGWDGSEQEDPGPLAPRTQAVGDSQKGQQ